MVSEFSAVAKRWVQVTILLAAGIRDGIRCPQNDDADVVVDVRTWTSETNNDDRRLEYWIHCPKCGAQIYWHSIDKSGPAQ
jgi:4-hydroxy-3-methylbut-2-en-1-yl diphosphate synthase IspG/GcpE